MGQMWFSSLSLSLPPRSCARPLRIRMFPLSVCCSKNKALHFLSGLVSTTSSTLVRGVSRASVLLSIYIFRSRFRTLYGVLCSSRFAFGVPVSRILCAFCCSTRRVAQKGLLLRLPMIFLSAAALEVS